MRKILFSVILCLVLSGVHAQNSSGIEISFNYNPQPGHGSNQFAVWIEDSEGKLIKTIFATKYTASIGWRIRPLSIPLWVQQAEPSTLSKKEIDAFSGATPRAGTLKYRWDGTDKDGNRMATGGYRVFLEATLRNDNKVLYSADITLGGSTKLETIVKTKYSGKGVKVREMIEYVRVFYTP